MTWNDVQVREHVSRVEASLSRLETEPSGKAGAEAVEELVVLYGQCLERIMVHAGAFGGRIQQVLADDELVGHLLLVHDLHPIDLAGRVRTALDEVRETVGMDDEVLMLLGIVGSRVRVRLHSRECDSTAARIRSVIEECVAKHAPEVDILIEEQPMIEQSVIPVSSLFAGGRVPDMR